MRIERSLRGTRTGAMRVAAVAAVTALVLIGCDSKLIEAIDDLRAAAPDICKNYCEDKLVCEWPVASGIEENDAFSAGVQRCTIDCAYSLGMGAYAARNGIEGLDFFRHVSGSTLKGALNCAMEGGAFRCTDGVPNDVHAFGAVVQSMCEDADACLGQLGIDQHLVWTPSASGGGTCATEGTEWLDTEFFLP
jgi:hypothetical protein